MLSHLLFCWPRRWETIREARLQIDYGNGDEGWGRAYDLRCKKCGWITYRKCY